jgi:hypothetical protein
MADIYKLQYNGMTLAYPGWNGYVAFEDAEVAYNLYLQQQIGGTITADKLSGMNGEIVTLGNTPDAGYQFNSYGITGAELSGNQFAFNGSDVSAQANFKEAVYTLTLQNDGHGTIAASKTTGHAGDTVTLSNTYNTYYRFNNYTVTGGTINGSTFTFGSRNATAKANFKVNSFTASGGWEKGSNVTGGGKQNGSTNVGAKYATTSYHTSNVPAGWYNTSNRWKVTSTVSGYKITLNPKMQFTGKCQSNSKSLVAAATGLSLIGSTTTQSQSWSTHSASTQTWNYSKSFTSNTTGVNYGISGKLAWTAAAGQYGATAGYVAANTTGTWTATGYIP